jgi:hypothetical protein
VILYHALTTPEFPKEMLEIESDGRMPALEDFTTLEVFGQPQ